MFAPTMLWSQQTHCAAIRISTRGDALRLRAALVERHRAIVDVASVTASIGAARAGSLFSVRCSRSKRSTAACVVLMRLVRAIGEPRAGISSSASVDSSSDAIDTYAVSGDADTDEFGRGATAVLVQQPMRDTDARRYRSTKGIPPNTH